MPKSLEQLTTEYAEKQQRYQEMLFRCISQTHVQGEHAPTFFPTAVLRSPSQKEWSEIERLRNEARAAEEAYFNAIRDRLKPAG